MESATQILIQAQLTEVQEKAATQWADHEQHAVIYIVRALEVAVGVNQSEYLLRNDEKLYAGYGATAALKPFLEKINDLPGPIPWMPSSPESSKFAFSYLIICGKLSYLYRLASLERFGLSRTYLTPNGPTIEIETSTIELAQTTAIKLAAAPPDPKIHKGAIIKRQNKMLSKKMHQYVDTENEWFIRYNNDQSIVKLYQKKAANYAAQFLEKEALPDDAIVGDRKFSEWKKACEYALGRILCHIDFARILKKKNPKIELTNINTIYVRKEDIEAVWLESGLPRDRIKTTMDALTIKANDLDLWEKDFEIPCPFYIEYSKDFLLLPCFGAIANPYFALFRHLRSTYAADWDRAVDQRENIFRSELSKVFPKSHYLIPPTGYKLRRDNNTTLTDVDAIIIERRSGAVALVQLKWHDIVGRSISQRDSRRKNILVANTWIERVSTWIDGRSSSSILTQLGIKNEQQSAEAPKLYVIARYTARFTGECMQDQRATWMGWHEMLVNSKKLSKKNRITSIPQAIIEFQKMFQGKVFPEETFTFNNFSLSLSPMKKQ